MLAVAAFRSYIDVPNVDCAHLVLVIRIGLAEYPESRLRTHSNVTARVVISVHKPCTRKVKYT